MKERISGSGLQQNPEFMLEIDGYANFESAYHGKTALLVPFRAHFSEQTSRIRQSQAVKAIFPVVSHFECFSTL